MNHTKYKVRHIRCNMQDFHADRHRFHFEYAGKAEVVACYGSVNLVYENETLPEPIKDEIAKIVFRKMDTDETHWRYPDEAYQIAENYCREEFSA